ncbi:amidase signature domain-containing protein [Sphaerosporella brunnea]|uniref:Amidase signature domain-containing protein n=1 Tax=Sphaerosporella brunnea TaxID=1250544 RepID=A0A5J5F7Q1_9PEZI|nr:amidase signature domain-containing protein [Sphaerosporella brunnea]
MRTVSIPAKPFAFNAPLSKTALLAIDLQRDFLLPGVVGDTQTGTVLSSIQAILPACQQLLKLFRDLELPVIHTREGHRPDLSDCPSSKLQISAQASTPCEAIREIGIPGSRRPVRGEYGHDLHLAVTARPRELVVDKPGKGAFWNTNLLSELQALGVTHLVVMGVTTECSVTTTVREANDRGFECLVIEECTAGYNDTAFKAPSLDMLHRSDGLFGYVGTLTPIVAALSPLIPSRSCTTTKAWSLASPNSLSIPVLSAAYQSSSTTPGAVVTALHQRLLTHPQISSIFLHLIPLDSLLRTCSALKAAYPDPYSRPPLYGIPFSIKDSIDLNGVPTTAACPPLSYTPTTSSTIVNTLLSLGAILVGKTNLDQLATGLTGCRSPHGIPPIPFSPAHIPGGSSSGSCVSVSSGLVSFSVGTDTAGSGRVPAGFNGIVGFKPTKGTVSFRGVVTACESLDCISVATTSVRDSRTLWRLCRGFDAEDRWAKHYPSVPRHVEAFPTKFRVLVPPAETLEICSKDYRRLFSKAIEKMRGLGEEVVVDSAMWSVFEDAGKLLYDGTLVYERLAGMPKGWFEQNQELLHPVTREVFRKVTERKSTAEDVFRDLNQMMSLRRRSQQIFSASAGGVSVLMVPTAPVHPTIEEVAADPIGINSLLGTFSHFGNVLDLCAIAVPAGFYSKEMDGVTLNLPFGVTLLSSEGRDDVVLDLAERFEAAEV